MATRNDIFKNVKIGETFYWGGNESVKLTEETASVYSTFYGTREVYYLEENDSVTVG
jgi:hypothetical protein